VHAAPHDRKTFYIHATSRRFLFFFDFARHVALTAQGDHMNRFILIVTLSPLLACAAQQDASGTSDLDVALICHTSAECPAPSVCDVTATAVCRLPATTPPIRKCDSTAECALHEVCDPICASAVGVVGHVCRPEGIAIHECPPPPPSCLTDAQCPAGDTCFICPGPATNASTPPRGTCLAPGEIHACPL
jgi:hypothetical protein